MEHMSTRRGGMMLTSSSVSSGVPAHDRGLSAHAQDRRTAEILSGQTESLWEVRDCLLLRGVFLG